MMRGADGPALLAELPSPRAGWIQLRARILQALIGQGARELAEGLRLVDQQEPVDGLLEVLALAPDPVLLAIDDVHNADPDLEEHLRRLADLWPEHGQLVLAGRRLPEGLGAPPEGTPTSDQRGWRIVDDEDLAFTLEESTALLGDPGGVSTDGIQALTERYEGWAAALDIAHRRLQDATTPSQATRELERLLQVPVTVTSLLDDLLVACTPKQRALLSQIAALPRFDDDLLRKLGWSDGVAGLRELGLPLRESGALRLPV